MEGGLSDLGEKRMRVGQCRERCRRHDGVCLRTVMGRKAHKRDELAGQATVCARFSPLERRAPSAVAALRQAQGPPSTGSGTEIRRSGPVNDEMCG